jgi:hypothetical protein
MGDVLLHRTGGPYFRTLIGSSDCEKLGQINVKFNIGTIELEMINLKPAAWFTWFIGGLALIAPLGESSYPTSFKFLLIVGFLAAYSYGIRLVLKNQSPC